MEVYNKKYSIAVCYYSPSDKYVSNSVCIPLQLGAFESGYELPITKDTSGINRGEKHYFYSEYSGIYWLWKNNNSTYKGIMHHRRFLCDHQEGFIRKCKHAKRFLSAWVKNLFCNYFSYFVDIRECNEQVYYKNIETLEKSLNSGKFEKYHILVPKAYHFYPVNNRDFYIGAITRPILQIVDQIIEEKHPDYIQYWIKTNRSRKIYYANISIMRDSYFDKYCDFVFHVFDELENKLISDGYYINLLTEKSVNRLFGYIGEMLTNTFVIKSEKEGAAIKELPLMVNTNSKGFQLK